MQMHGRGHTKPQSSQRKVVLEALFRREITVYLCGFLIFFKKNLGDILTFKNEPFLHFF